MRRMSVDGPQTGDWFAVAFVSWTDPSNDRIEQQGMFNHSFDVFLCVCSNLWILARSSLAQTPLSPLPQSFDLF